MDQKGDTRERILDIAEASVLEKGFEATSIEEIVAGAGISRGGFFYHFKDKNALARAMLERYIEVENALYDDLFARARDLDDDPLHAMLIGLKLLAEMLSEMPTGHPGCVIASTAYQDRLFDEGVRELNRQAILGWRKRFRGMFEEIAERYEPPNRSTWMHLAIWSRASSRAALSCSVPCASTTMPLNRSCSFARI